MHIHTTLSEKEVTVKDFTIYGRAYFGGGKSVEDSDVKVYSLINGSEELYLQLTTDENGEFSFQQKEGIYEYKIVVEATHMPGHSSEEFVNLTGLAFAGSGNESIKEINIGCPESEGEIPLYMRVIAGFGYLMGLLGISLYYLARK